MNATCFCFRVRLCMAPSECDIENGVIFLTYQNLYNFEKFPLLFRLMLTLAKQFNVWKFIFSPHPV